LIDRDSIYLRIVYVIRAFASNFKVALVDIINMSEKAVETADYLLTYGALRFPKQNHVLDILCLLH
jgi:hypothetical protein